MSEAAPQFTWDHIHLFVTDQEAAAQWFGDLLGAEIIRSPVRIVVKLGGASIFFQQVPDDGSTGDAPVSPHKGLDHFALAVKDIDRVAADLKAKGAVITKGPETARPGVRVCFIEGPANISIELLDRDPKYT